MSHLLRNEVFLGVLTVIGTVCWVACFWCMWRISRRQDAMLKQLHEQTKRIASLSKAEHDLIREVHPQVGEIKEAIEEVLSDAPSSRNQKR